jgi:hypothetical protein
MSPESADRSAINVGRGTSCFAFGRARLKLPEAAAINTEGPSLQVLLRMVCCSLCDQRSCRTAMQSCGLGKSVKLPSKIGLGDKIREWGVEFWLRPISSEFAECGLSYPPHADLGKSESGFPALSNFTADRRVLHTSTLACTSSRDAVSELSPAATSHLIPTVAPLTPMWLPHFLLLSASEPDNGRVNARTSSEKARGVSARPPAKCSPEVETNARISLVMQLLHIV